MNLLKVLQKTLPDLARVIESIHAYLEKQLEEQKITNTKLDELIRLMQK